MLELRQRTYGTRDLAFLTGLSRDTVERRLSRGEFPGAVLMGGSMGWVVPRRAVRAYLRKNPPNSTGITVDHVGGNGNVVDRQVVTSRSSRTGGTT